MAKAAIYKVYTGSAWEELTFTPSSHTHSDYIKGLSVSGKVITYTKGDGSTGTITTQDTNTTYTLSSFGITATAAELNYVDGVTSNIQTQLNGKAASSHTHSQYLTSTSSVSEAYLTWGGKNFSGSYGPIDAAMVPELGANRFAFFDPAAITIEYSTNGGSTWTTYSTTDAAKSNLFNGNGATYTIGGSTTTKIDKTNHRLRITLNTKDELYTVLNKFCILVSTSGSSGCWCTIDARLQSNYEAGTDTWQVFANQIAVSGWSGYNIINTSGITTYGNTKTSQYGQVRFTFGVTSHASTVTYPGLSITKIMGFGGVGWTIPSTMAKTGNIFTYDHNQSVTFPAGVTATSFNGTTLYEGGTSLANKYSTLANTIKALSISGKTITYTKGDGTTGTLTTQDTNTTYSKATSSALGLVKIGYSENGKNYPVELDSDGKMFVNVPWTDNNTTYSAATDSALGLVMVGGVRTIANSDLNSTTSSSGRFYKVERSSATNQLFVNVPWTDTDTTYSKATSSALGLVKIGYSENGKNYPVELDSDGKMFVNVPWTDTDNNTTYSQATSSALGLVKIGYSENGKNYPVELDSDGKMFVNVPWTDNNTTYSQATSSALGLVKIGYTTSGKNYAVQLDSNGKMYVNVPWTDTDNNTTYSIATASTAGLVKPVSVITKPTLQSVTTTAGKYYQVQMSSDGNMFVNVPWTDTNTDTDTGATSVTVSGSGNAVTSASYDASTRKLTLTKGTTFLTSHQTMYYRPIQVNGTQILANTASTALNLKAGSNVSITNSSGTVTIAATNTTYSNATTSAAGLMSADDKKNLTYYVKGTQTASTNAWTGNLTQVSALYEGLTIRYRLPYAGTSTGATLNLTLSGGTTGAKNVYRYGTTTQITTHFAANSVITMTYNGTNWIVDAFYDSNSYAYVRQYKTTTDATYPLLFAYETALPSSYDTKYTRKNSNLTFNPSTGQLNATILSAGIASSTNGKVVFQNTEGGTVTLTPGVESGSNVTLYLPENNGKRLMLGIATTDGTKYADDEGLVSTTLTTKTYVDNAVANAGGGSSGDADGPFIDLGTMSEHPTVITNTVLNQVTESGLYTVTYDIYNYIVFVNRLTGEGYDYVYQTVFSGTTGSLCYYMRFSSDGGATYTTSTYYVPQQDTDTKSSTYHTTTDANYPLTFEYSSGITSTSTLTNYKRRSNKLYFNPSTGVLTVPKISDGTRTASVSDITQYKLIQRHASVATNTNVALGTYLSNCKDVMIIVRATYAANGTIVIGTTSGTEVCSKKFTAAGTYYTKVTLNVTDDGNVACEINGLPATTNTFGWTNTTALQIKAISNGAATVVVYGR